MAAVQSDKRLYVGNLSTTVDEYLLMQVCAKHGKISKLDYLFHKTGPQKGKPRGYAFVEYSSKEEAQRALQALNDKVLRGRKMVISLASEQQEEKTPMGTKKGRGAVTSDALKPTAISLLKGGGHAKAPVNRKIAALEAKLAAMRQAKTESSGGSATPPSRSGTPADDAAASAWLDDNLPEGSKASGSGEAPTTAAPTGTAAIDVVAAGLPLRPFFTTEEAPRKM